MLVEQDAHLDRLSHSIGRQRDISLQINDELDVHTGLLEELDTDLDQTHNRLSGAAKRLQTFSRGVRGNCESPICTESTFVTNYLCFLRFDVHYRSSDIRSPYSDHYIQDIAPLTVVLLVCICFVRIL